MRLLRRQKVHIAEPKDFYNMIEKERQKFVKMTGRDIPNTSFRAILARQNINFNLGGLINETRKKNKR